MTDLTNKWKKGKLPEGNDKQWCTYYIQHKDGTTNADSYWGGFWGVADDCSIVEVLEKVPSYEEYTKLKEELKDYEYQHKQDGICYDDIFCKLELARKENRQLKELLKECIIYVDKYVTFSTVRGNEEREVKSKELLAKINQALGEDK